MEIAERNRLIKKAMQKAFPNTEIKVKGSRGTAYGWVRVYIGYQPRNLRERQELYSLVQQLAVKASNGKIDHYGYDDPGSDYGYGLEINIEFAPLREQTDPWDRENAWRQHLSKEAWDDLQRQSGRA